MEIVIPTHGRAGNMLTVNKGGADLSTLWLCVAESQVASYRAAHPDARFMVHPDSVVGLAAKRQWIYEKVGDVFMIDDDLLGFKITMQEQWRYIRWPDVIARIWNMRRIASELGTVLYGFRDAAHPVSFHPQDPFDFRKMVRGSAFGMMPSEGNLWFHPDIVCNEDLWISLLAAYHYRLIVVDSRCASMLMQTGTGQGGQGGRRTEGAFRSDWNLLREYFGDAVVQKQENRYHTTRRYFTADGRKDVEIRPDYHLNDTIHPAMSLPWKA